MSSYAAPPTLSSGTIALLVIGGTLDVVIIAVVVYVVLRRRERNLQELKDIEAGRRAKRQQSRQSMARRAASIKRRVMEWRDVPGSHRSNSSNSRKSNTSDASRPSQASKSQPSSKDLYDSDSDTEDLLPPVPALPSPKVWASPFSSSEDPIELPTTRDDRNDFAPGELHVQRPASAALPSPVLSTAPSLPDFAEYRAHDAGKTATSRNSSRSSAGGANGAHRWTWKTQSSGLGHALGMRGEGAMPAAWQSARTSRATTRQASQKTVSSKKWSLMS